ncbi:MAG: toprim domain-containing protein [Candidatus Paceibacterota bacterium]|jgi:recombination protein RecR
MNSFEKLKELFGHFPGIGPRQAERFAYYLLSKDAGYIEEFKSYLSTLKKDVAQCKECMRYFSKRTEANLCAICSDTDRDESVLMLVAKDNDLMTVEKSDVYRGKYFVLGGLIPILEKNPEKRVRLSPLLSLIETRKEKLKEVIFALSATHEGEHTADFVGKSVRERLPAVKLSHLGRGLSTGLEIEYSDSDTIKAALQNKFSE